MLELKKWVDRKETPFYLKNITKALTFIEDLPASFLFLWGTEEQKSTENYPISLKNGQKKVNIGIVVGTGDTIIVIYLIIKLIKKR